MYTCLLIPKIVCMYMQTITNLFTSTVSLSIWGFRHLLTDCPDWKEHSIWKHNFCWRSQSQKRWKITTGYWAIPIMNCNRQFTCLKCVCFNNLCPTNIDTQNSCLKCGLVCLRTEYCELSRGLVLSHNILCYARNPQSVVHRWNVLYG